MSTTEQRTDAPSVGYAAKFLTAAQVEALALLAEGAVIVAAPSAGKGNRYPWHIIDGTGATLSRLTAAGFAAFDAAGLVGVHDGHIVITNRGISALCSSSEKGAAKWQRERRIAQEREAHAKHGNLWLTVRSMIRANAQFYGMNPDTPARLALFFDSMALDVCNTIAAQTERGREALALLDYVDTWVTHTGPLTIHKTDVLVGARERTRTYDGVDLLIVGDDETTADAIRALRAIRK